MGCATNATVASDSSSSVLDRRCPRPPPLVFARGSESLSASLESPLSISPRLLRNDLAKDNDRDNIMTDQIKSVTSSSRSETDVLDPKDKGKGKGKGFGTSEDTESSQERRRQLEKLDPELELEAGPSRSSDTPFCPDFTRQPSSTTGLASGSSAPTTSAAAELAPKSTISSLQSLGVDALGVDDSSVAPGPLRRAPLANVASGSVYMLDDDPISSSSPSTASSSPAPSVYSRSSRSRRSSLIGALARTRLTTKSELDSESAFSERKARPSFGRRLSKSFTSLSLSSMDTLPTGRPSSSSSSRSRGSAPISSGDAQQRDGVRLSTDRSAAAKSVSESVRSFKLIGTSRSARRRLQEGAEPGVQMIGASASPLSVPLPPRSRSHSAPLVPSRGFGPSPLSRELLRDILPLSLDAGFVTALSSPTTEHPPSVPSPDRALVDAYGRLPSEIQTKIMRALVDVCRVEHEREVAQANWIGSKSTERWVGEARGRRELVKCARVSRAWKKLAYDGQAWPSIDVSEFGADVLSTPGILRLSEGAGPFVQNLSLVGMSQITGYTLVEMARLIGSPLAGETNLIALDLTGCSSISTTSLSFLLSRCPHLVQVNLLALPSVQDETLRILGTTAKTLGALDVSRCANFSAWSLVNITSQLKHLRVAKVNGLCDQVVRDLMHYHASLETLDISSNSSLTDLAFESIGPEAGLASLRHLSLASCRLLTDRALERLVDRIPQLRYLELSHNRAFGTTSALDDLLLSTPLLTRLDLEDNVGLTEGALASLVSARAVPDLEWLVLSGCSSITEACLTQLIEATSRWRLEVLEVDGTNIDEASAINFVSTRHRRMIQSSLDTPTTSRSSNNAPSPKISILDARFLTRRLQRELSRQIRTRDGHRGYTFRHFGYIDPEVPSSSAPAQKECDASSRVVLRSFHSHLAVDAAIAARKVKAKGPKIKGRARAWSDFARRIEDQADEEESAGRAGCIVS